MNVTVIVPTYNEAENLPKLVSALFLIPKQLNILIVDDNSPDGTGEIADQLAKENPGRVNVLHRSGKLGLRTAYLSAFEIAIKNGADVLVQMDADFSHDPQTLPAMLAALQNADVVLGSRYVSGGGVDKAWPRWRKALSAFGNFYARTILNFPLRDVTTGFRVWKKEVIENMPLERIDANGYIFLVEMAYMAYCLQYKIAQSPIYFADRRWGKSKMSLSIQFEAAFRIWQVRWQYRDLLKAGKKARTQINVSHFV